MTFKSSSVAVRLTPRSWVQIQQVVYPFKRTRNKQTKLLRRNIWDLIWSIKLEIFFFIWKCRWSSKVKGHTKMSMIVQQDATIYGFIIFSADSSTRFGWYPHPSSGGHSNCNYNIWHWSNRICYRPLTWRSRNYGSDSSTSSHGSK